MPKILGKIDQHDVAQALQDLQVGREHIGKFQCFKGKGCSTCSETGFKGRIAIYEVMAATDPLKELILNGGSSAELKSEAIRLGMKTLRQGAITKLMEGTTTMEEVSRVSAPD